MSKLSISIRKEIDAPVSKVWKALTDPVQIKQYLFGTDVHTDWQKGSTITYTGEWQGKAYEDKGTIIEIIPDRLLHTTYWSGMSGKPDQPENYVNVIYRLEPNSGGTSLILDQDGIDNEEGVKHMDENWNMVLDGLKKVAEGG